MKNAQRPAFTAGFLHIENPQIVICTPKVGQTLGGAYFYGKKGNKQKKYSAKFKIHILLQKQDLAYRVYRRAPRNVCGARGVFLGSDRKILEIFSNPLTES